ncbi:hypothetical protein E2562_028992 [Oryza meyeriana var. granulata]|uniref:Uncharacterized protein n=1 Tax=Oryza meyeriana var. granulata TaxID=110450 RepID=A0A6G1E3S9_9ORYZ|nr:hypothetical protein E2562_028992 [Oryza meyeriana var. granulata]
MPPTDGYGGGPKKYFFNYSRGQRDGTPAPLADQRDNRRGGQGGRGHCLLPAPVALIGVDAAPSGPWPAMAAGVEQDGHVMTVLPMQSSSPM